MRDKSVAWIRGIEGSGKTWLCQSLMANGIQCYDTDEIIQKVFRDLRESSPEFRKLIRAKWSDTKNWWMTMSNEARRVIEKIVHNSSREGKSVVIVGNSLEGDIKGVNQIYFIKMSDKALRASFRRLLRREVTKIVTNSDRVFEVIDHDDVEDIGPVLSNVLTPAIRFGSDFHYYKARYKQLLRDEKARGSIVLTQPEILKQLVKI